MNILRLCLLAGCLSLLSSCIWGTPPAIANESGGDITLVAEFDDGKTGSFSLNSGQMGWLGYEKVKVKSVRVDPGNRTIPSEMLLRPGVQSGDEKIVVTKDGFEVKPIK